MKIELLQSALKKLPSKPNMEIKNRNELYIKTSSDFVKEIVKLLLSEHKLNFISEFCKHIEKDKFIINIILSGKKQGYYAIVSYETSKNIVSLQSIVTQSHLFEREISDLFGLKIDGASDDRNLVKHECWSKDEFPLRKDFAFGKKLTLANTTPNYKFKAIASEGGIQIPVGPVHAGIIEPGHFRFSVIGEPIDNLEIRLMYKHRGIEKLCENVDANDLNLVFERVSGESSVAYSECYALLVEKLLSYNVPYEIKALRVLFLELERIYNFLDDIGGICTDVGYSYPAKKFSYLSEQIHQLSEKLTGSRFMRNVIVPCGINVNFNLSDKNVIEDCLSNLKTRFSEIVNSTLTSVTFLDRVENTGIVNNETAKKFCMTGVVGRASGLKFDVRCKFPYEIYNEIKKGINTEEAGGVYERYKLKIKEIYDAFGYIQDSLSYINSDIKKYKPDLKLPNNEMAISSVETVKGELIVYGETSSNNKFNRIYFKTPSFTNWDGLTKAVLGEIVPDFPLCNKSFNMSYAENDK